jgi:hypothetical protein
VAEIVISIFSFLVSFSLNIHVVGCATTKEDGGHFHYPLYSFKANLGGYMGPPSAGVTGAAKFERGRSLIRNFAIKTKDETNVISEKKK